MKCGPQSTKFMKIEMPVGRTQEGNICTGLFGEVSVLHLTDNLSQNNLGHFYSK